MSLITYGFYSGKRYITESVEFEIDLIEKESIKFNKKEKIKFYFNEKETIKFKLKEIRKFSVNEKEIIKWKIS